MNPPRPPARYARSSTLPPPLGEEDSVSGPDPNVRCPRRKLPEASAIAYPTAMPDWMRTPMYRSTQLQGPEFDAEGLLPQHKAERCERSWAGPFRRQALPILLEVEDQFADLYDAKTGRPNRSVALLLGVHILKDMHDLTDQEVLDALEFDTRWWWAFQLDPREMHLCQKTLHNFRVNLIAHAKSKLPFRTVTDRLIQALGVKVDRQRHDSTQILSNFAALTRLGVICETMRVFLAELEKLDARLYEEVPPGLRARHGDTAPYQDARRKEGPRRLAVAARDVWRLIDRFQGSSAVASLPAWKLLVRLFEEQCVVRPDAKGPEDGDADREDGPAPVELKEAKKVQSSSMQTPHDPDVTYSGHKGKGYSAQVSETCSDENQAQMITGVEVTPACENDAKATVSVVNALEEAGHKPNEFVADTSFSGAENAAELAKRDVDLLAPIPAAGKPDPDKVYPPPAEHCPQDIEGAAEWLRCQEAHPSFRKRYSIRAGSEATISELKRGHGMRKLRVRGRERVSLAVYFKALACNVKRALARWRQCMGSAEGAAALG